MLTFIFCNCAGYIEIEKVDVFRKVLNKQFTERLKAISIIYIIDNIL